MRPREGVDKYVAKSFLRTKMYSEVRNGKERIKRKEKGRVCAGEFYINLTQASII